MSVEELKQRIRANREKYISELQKCCSEKPKDYVDLMQHRRYASYCELQRVFMEMNRRRDENKRICDECVKMSRFERSAKLARDEFRQREIELEDWTVEKERLEREIFDVNVQIKGLEGPEND